MVKITIETPLQLGKVGDDLYQVDAEGGEDGFFAEQASLGIYSGKTTREIYESVIHDLATDPENLDDVAEVRNALSFSELTFTYIGKILSVEEI